MDNQWRFTSFFHIIIAPKYSVPGSKGLKWTVPWNAEGDAFVVLNIWGIKLNELCAVIDLDFIGGNPCEIYFTSRRS